MFCPYCAKEVATDAVVCIGCGRSVAPRSSNTPKTEWGTGALTGLVIGTIFLPVIGIIAGVTNLREEARRSQARALLTVGLVVGCLNVLVLVS